MGRVVHFELPADDPQRAVGFYRDVFGWQVEGWHGDVEYFLATTGAEDSMGINGAILRRDAPVTALVATISVESLDDTLTRLKAAGGRVIRERMPVPGVGWHAYCEDTEGNVVGVLQPDESAA